MTAYVSELITQTFGVGSLAAPWLGAAVIFIGLFLFFYLFQRVLLRHFENLAQKTRTDLDDVLVKIIRSLRPPFYTFLAFWLAVQTLSLPAIIGRLVDIILIIWVTWLTIVGLQILIDYFFKRSRSAEEDPGAKAALATMGKVAKGILWALGALFILSNLGINVSSLLAGLGIGGVAVALALQNILGDLFSSFAIYFDKPFVVGDVIKVDDFIGKVEKIGIKTTRLRALQGEEVVLSNRELTSARVQNFKKLEERRVVVKFGVVYETPTKKLRRIPGIIKKIVGSTKLTRFDRTHFTSFGDSALLFEAVYYVGSPDYNVYMDANQKIHLAIKNAFEKEGLVMAYPTQTVYLAKNND